MLCAIFFVVSAESLTRPDSGILVESFEYSSGSVRVAAPYVGSAYKIEGSQDGRLEFTAIVPEAVKPIEYEASILISNVRRDADISYCINPGPTKAFNNDPSVYKRYAPAYFPLPNGICAGKALTVGVTHGDLLPALGPVYFATDNEVKNAYRWRKFFGVDLIIVSAGIALITGAIALINTTLATNKQIYVSFIGLMTAWGANCFLLVGPFGDINQILFDTWFHGSTFLIVLFLYAVIDAITNTGWRHRAVHYAGGAFFLRVCDWSGCVFRNSRRIQSPDRSIRFRMCVDLRECNSSCAPYGGFTGRASIIAILTIFDAHFCGLRPHQLAGTGDPFSLPNLALTSRCNTFPSSRSSGWSRCSYWLVKIQSMRKIEFENTMPSCKPA